MGPEVCESYLTQSLDSVASIPISVRRWILYLVKELVMVTFAMTILAVTIKMGIKFLGKQFDRVCSEEEKPVSLRS